jgi:hypothetical protein
MNNGIVAKTATAYIQDNNFTIGSIYAPKIDITELQDRIDRIEHVLGIIPRRRDLESKYPDLKEIGNKMDNNIFLGARDYRAFMQECEIMEKLKSNV